MKTATATMIDETAEFNASFERMRIATGPHRQAAVIRTDWQFSDEQIMADVRRAGLRPVSVLRTSGYHAFVKLVGGPVLTIIDGQTLDAQEVVRDVANGLI